MKFYNRTRELNDLERWWKQPEPRFAAVWGRRRVGKTALINKFAEGKQTIFHVGAGRPMADELAILTEQVIKLSKKGIRDYHSRPYNRWEDALEDLYQLARDEPVLLVLDEFPELVVGTPYLPGVLRAFLDRAQGNTHLRILLCGSAVRHMEAMQEYRAPLYGRFDLNLLLQPFTPVESALLLPDISPAERALVYGLVGGVPLYLSWWDQHASVKENLRNLAGGPAAPLIAEGQLVLATEVEPGELPAKILHAIAAGHTKHNEIKSVIDTEPSRTIERLIRLRLVERVEPVTERGRSRKVTYRIRDNFLSFYLSVLGRYLPDIESGLGDTILPILVSKLDDHLGPRWEETFRTHVRRIAVEINEQLVAVGPFWTRDGQNEIDAVGLAGVEERPVFAAEAKWSKRVNGARIAASLAEKVKALPGVEDPDGLQLAVCARETIDNLPPGIRGITSADIFG